METLFILLISARIVQQTEIGIIEAAYTQALPTVLSLWLAFLKVFILYLKYMHTLEQVTTHIYN